MSGPLTGVKVLDFTGVVSGPLATMFLADQGADVLKVEPLGGDITRRSRQPIDEAGEFSALFVSSNRGKRSISLDAKAEAGREILLRLIEDADVLVQNFRPGAMERLDLGADQLRARFPRLIYVSINGVGEDGPYASKRVYDPIVQALSGIADIQAEPVTGRPRMIRTIVADKTSAIFTAQAISAALYAREKTGVGDHIKVAMLDAMLSYLWPEGMMQYTVVGKEAATADPNLRPDQVFETADGYITAGTISNMEWKGFCEAVERPDLIDDLRFSTPSARTANGTERINLMGTLLKDRSSEEWLNRLDAADVPCAPILRRKDIVGNAHIVARKLLTELDQPTVGRVRQPQPAARFQQNVLDPLRPAPSIGGDTQDVLRQLGFTDREIERLMADKVVRAPRGST